MKKKLDFLKNILYNKNNLKQKKRKNNNMKEFLMGLGFVLIWVLLAVELSILGSLL